MRKLYSLFATLLVALLTHGQTYHNLSSGPLLQNWSNTNLITANDSWSGVPGIIGYLGQDITTSTGSNPQTLLSTSSVANDIDVIANQTNPNITNGGVAEFEIANPTIALQGSGTADAPHIVLYLNTLGTTDVRIQYRLRDIDATGDNAIQPVALQYRIGNTGNFTNVPAAFVADATSGPNLATMTTDIDVTLPAAVSNQAQVQIRIITTNAVGNDEWVGIDDINVSAATSGGDFTPPVVFSLSPSDGAANVSINATATITFSETIQKGTGKIYVRRASDGTAVQTIDVTSSQVSVSGEQATFALLLANSTAYYIEIETGAFKDVANNSFEGISNNTTWNFTTVAPPANGILGNTYTFNNCGNLINEGFKTYSVAGAQEWTCTKFGLTYTADPSVDFAIEMNGFSGGNNINEDWLISPKFDLTSTDFPLLDFYSRSRFAGPSLSLKISTDYAGSGNPALATWTTLLANFPAANSNVWTLSDSINLSAFKTNNVHLAWVYTSTSAASSRWSLDDIVVYNSSVPPAPSLLVNERLIDFRQVTAGAVSAGKELHFYATDLTSDLTVTAPAGFEISKDGSTYSSSVTIASTETGTGLQTVYIRFIPSAVNTVYSGTIRFSSTGIDTKSLFVKGNTYPLSATLNVVNWNIEWFGSTGNGPSDENLQLANAKKVMDALDADVYALAEIVRPSTLATLTASLAGSYSYVIGEYCSGGTTATSCASSQKLALVYKTNVLSNIKARPLMITSATARTNWASGRVPFLVTADVAKNGLTQTINFIVVHGKANTGNTADQIESYFERKAGIQELKDTLDTYFANANVILLGDYNDDLDRTIAPTTGNDTVSSYQSLIADSTDANHYRSLTLPLSYAGLSSTTGFPDVIDHVVISNELSARYVELSATVFNDIEAVAGIQNFAETTSDHYPIMTRFVFCKLVCLQSVTVATDPGKCGATVNFGQNAVSTCGTVTFTPASGSFFPVGTTVVNMSNSYGETCSFNVTVEDKTKPNVSCPQNMVVNPASLSGAAVRYSIIATDNCGTPFVRQTAGLPSGSVFPIGTTNNSFEVTDASGNVSTCSFAVTVRNPYCDNNEKNKKVYVCQNGNTICVSVNALEAFLKKGANLGQCEWYEPSMPTTRPAENNVSGNAVQPAALFTFRTYPNPVAKNLVIEYSVPATAAVNIKVYDLMGREVRSVFNGRQSAGLHTIKFDAGTLSPGVYYCRIVATTATTEHVQMEKLVKTK